MKIKKIILGILLFISFSAFAQNQNDDILRKCNEILSVISNAQGIKDLVKIKERIESEVTNIKDSCQSCNVDSIEIIHLKYEILRSDYNSIFDELKNDIVKKNTFRDTRAARLVLKYSNRIDTIKKEYYDYHNCVSSLPNYRSRIILKGNGDEGLSLGFSILTWGIDKLIEIDNKNKESKKTFSEITPVFLSKYYIKGWTDIWPDYSTNKPLQIDKILGQNGKVKPLSKPYNDNGIVQDKILISKILSNQHGYDSVRIPIGLRNLGGSNNITKLETTTSFPAGSTFSVSCNSEKFVYFFGVDTNKIELLYPNIIPDSIANRPKLNYKQENDTLFTIPQKFIIDGNGEIERWIILISLSEIFNPSDFANEYLKINGQSSLKQSTLVLKTTRGKSFDPTNCPIKDENTDMTYQLTDLVKVFDVIVLKK
ncbi:MAG: hypothetical protein WCH34_02790 [Bacteroidota bacterium]